MKDMTLAQLNATFYGGDGVNSLVDMLGKRVEQFGSKRNAMAYRVIDRLEKGEIEEGGKKKPWEFIHLKPTEYLTFTQMWEKMINFGKGLVELGFTAGSRVGLYEETRYEWLVSLYGLWSQSLTG
ncbi:fatty acyl synthetase 1, putative, partial [Bodo saltans]